MATETAEAAESAESAEDANAVKAAGTAGGAGRRAAPPVVGTPWTRSATRVALLGSGEIGKEIAIALMRLGVEVTAVDRYDGAPAQQVAHGALTVDMSDSLDGRASCRERV